MVKNLLGIADLEKENAQLRGTVQDLTTQLSAHKSFVSRRVSELKDYTRVDADVGIRGNNTIILTGVYRGQAYVRFWDVGDGEFEHLVRQMKGMKDHCLIRNIDSLPSFKGMFDL